MIREIWKKMSNDKTLLLVTGDMKHVIELIINETYQSLEQQNLRNNLLPEFSNSKLRKRKWNSGNFIPRPYKNQ
jgi:hypothetical protein